MRNLILTTVCAASLVAALPAAAQETQSVGLSLRAGLFLPTDRGVRDVSDSWFAFGADYKLFDAGTCPVTGNPATLSLSFDFASRNDFRTVPLVLNYVVRSGSLYYFGGAGVSFSRYPIGATTIEDKLNFAYQVGAGYDFPSSTMPVFLEGKFMGNGRSRLNGFGFFAGVRF